MARCSFLSRFAHRRAPKCSFAQQFNAYGLLGVQLPSCSATFLCRCVGNLAETRLPSGFLVYWTLRDTARCMRLPSWPETLPRFGFSFGSTIVYGTTSAVLRGSVSDGCGLHREGPISARQTSLSLPPSPSPSTSVSLSLSHSLTHSLAHGEPWAQLVKKKNRPPGGMSKSQKQTAHRHK